MSISENTESVEDGFGDIDIKSDKVQSESLGVMEESSSIEELAGIEDDAQSEVESATKSQEVKQEPVAPPLPAEGLPEGWSMEQWKWYGAQWLANQEK